MNIKDDLKNIIKEALKNLKEKGIFDFSDDIGIELEHPDNMTFGDYSSNIAMKLSGFLKGNPLEIAEKIKEEILNNESIEKVEVVKPGFLNFYLSKKFFLSSLKEILENEDNWGGSQKFSKEKYLIEHSSPNLFKPFHVGHLVNNIVGESISRIIKFSGAEVSNITFPSDVSPGIAKTVWAILKNDWQNDLTIEKIGEAYAFGTRQYEESDDIKNEVDKINSIIYKGEKGEELNVYLDGKGMSLEYFNEIMERLGSDFEDMIFESEAEEVGKKVVQENIPNVFEESEGAVIFRGSKYDLYDGVFINSAGFATYGGKDIGLLKIKFDKYKFDTSITITDVEQKQHFELVKKAAELINKEWSDKSQYIQHGRLKFAGEKVSSRLGNVPLVNDLIDSIKENLLEKFPESEDDILESIAIGALKYSVAKVNTGSNMVFDFETALAVEGNTGPYLQYSHVRCLSVLEKAKENLLEPKIIEDSQITNIEKILYRFPEAVLRSAENLDQHYVANYLYELASEFNSWYAKEKILSGESDQNHKLAITKAVKITLKNGLTLLGISTPKKM